MNIHPAVDPASTVPSPAYYPPTYPNEPEFIDLSDAIEPGDFVNPDVERLSGILAKINHLLLLTDTVNQEAQLCL